ncbi:SDR family NAD(P)-dependent oxidoreductase [Actinacidiphila oryziradicis]|uniref:SDR family NAD(P)-dependent oxidoreductase n=1 Tax=Actinacidiphila oryziradicis TaxID=2571141 RepID=UPI001FE2D0CE|nr:SDR family NAD(P)-dependent oxidoreductase [Actinacidiphila oryziradicis]
MTTSRECGEASGGIVVTGASTGIGLATARELAHRGFHVLAGVRRESEAEALRAPNIEPVIPDITDRDHITALEERVGGSLRALVNNAGIAINAPVEALPMSEWRRQFDVNLFGHIAVTQAAARAATQQEARSQLHLDGGRVAMHAYGAYAGSKFALEAVSDSLRRELASQGVEAIVVAPGAVKTNIAMDGAVTADRIVAAMTADQNRRYGPLMQAIIAHSASFTTNGTPAGEAAKVIAKAATTRNPRTRYTIGRDAAMLTRLSRALPDRLLDRFLAFLLRPHYATGRKAQVHG